MFAQTYSAKGITFKGFTAESAHLVSCYSKHWAKNRIDGRINDGRGFDATFIY